MRTLRWLLIVIWHLLRKEIVDKYHNVRDVACSFFKLAYAVKVRNLPDKLSAIQFVGCAPRTICLSPAAELLEDMLHYAYRSTLTCGVNMKKRDDLDRSKLNSVPGACQ